MDLLELQAKLIAAARRHPPSDHVPYAFERRVMARLAPAHLAEKWSGWAHVWWRATAPFLAITVWLGIWAYSAGGLSEVLSLDTELESIAYAAIDSDGEAW